MRNEYLRLQIRIHMMCCCLTRAMPAFWEILKRTTNIEVMNFSYLDMNRRTLVAPHVNGTKLTDSWEGDSHQEGDVVKDVDINIPANECYVQPS
jgi:hypothetical protein